MRVFDFSNQTEEKVNPECTYTTFRSNEEISTPEHPIFVLDNKEKEHAHHSTGFFTNPTKRTAFEFKEENSKESYTADILKVDSRFVGLGALAWRQPYQCAFVRRKYSRRICSL